ncbi:MAG: hypothetical protein RLZZ164_305 [Actinomycetota bacterium]|jgi:uncharacterized protein YciI
MAVYAVTYKYVPDAETISAVRPSHRAWLAEQLEAGALLASGPMVDTPTALLIWNAEDIESLAGLLDQEPFAVAGLIEERTIQQWNPVFGPWSSL